MANLILRNLDEEVVKALEKQAARHGRSAEAEHRAILSAALTKARRGTLAEVLASMPNVGSDEDFERARDEDGSAAFNS